ncbi:NADH-quinone oxidoreductase subunit NuoE [Myxococcota bacterium]
MDKNTMAMQRSEEDVELNRPLSEIRKTFIGRPEELIPMLQVVQRALGYLPDRALEEIARLTGLPAASVFGVATFYSQFRLQPVGKHVIKVCRGTACHVRGSGRIQRDVEAQLEVAPGQTTSDRLFTLETVACFGSCALAPVVVVDDSVHGRMDSSTCTSMLADLANPMNGDPDGGKSEQ